MASFGKWTLVVGLLAAGTSLSAQDRFPWAATLEQAQQAAEGQRKLVLLHFYNDHCPPCLKVEQNVFTQPQAAEAIGRNFVPVKIHAGQQPRIAQKYQVNRWPTDIVCTPAGLEVFRTTSPQSAEQYVLLMDNVALQAGVGASRQWATTMQAAGEQTAGQAVAQAQNLTGQGVDRTQAAANQAATTVQGYTDQASAAANHYAQQANQQVNQSTQQLNQTAEQAQAKTQQWGQQATTNWRQMNGAAQQMGTVAANAAGDVRSTWDSAALRAPQPAQPPPAPIGPPAASLPTSNPWLGQQAAPQQALAPQPNAVAEIGPVAGPAAPSNEQLIPASQAPPIALEGYCPVTLLQQRKWRKADAKFGAIHRGRTYLFASEVEQKQFLANPDGFSPVLSGFDPVVFAQRGELVEGQRSYGLTYNKQIFLFADEASLKAFEQSPRAYATTAHQAMMQTDTAPKYR
ncbi:MAG: DUF255 domain-containing protein [Pirellulaceae bacterium]